MILRILNLLDRCTNLINLATYSKQAIICENARVGVSEKHKL